MDSTPLNPQAKPWLPESHRRPNLPLQRRTSLLLPPPPPSLKKETDESSLISNEISTPKQQNHDMFTTLIYYYYSPTPYMQFFHLQNFPFYPPTYYSVPFSLPMKNDQASLVEGERALKKLLKIDVVDEKKKKIPRRFLPPRLKNSVCKQWRSKTFKDGGNSRTTVMVKNIPNQFRRKSLMEFLDHYCRDHQLEYDFFYLPMDFRSKDNLGFAFVNFTTSSSALKIKATLSGYKWGVVRTATGQFASKKTCEITWARIQGKDALVQHFDKSIFVCNNEEYLPVVISPPRNGINSSSTTMSNVGSMHRLFQAPRMLKK